MRQLLPFVVAGESYALELDNIQEVVENLSIYPFPGAPDVVVGAIAFHGRIVPVVDLFQLLGFGCGTLGKRLIVLTNAQGPVALGVEQVLPIMSIESARAQLPDEKAKGDYVKSFVHSESAMFALFDLERMKAQLTQLCVDTGG
jgi:purine-binding chemotaxis protein CheW